MLAIAFAVVGTADAQSKRKKDTKRLHLQPRKSQHPKKQAHNLMQALLLKVL